MDVDPHHGREGIMEQWMEDAGSLAAAGLVESCINRNITRAEARGAGMLESYIFLQYKFPLRRFSAVTQELDAIQYFPSSNGIP